MATRYMKEASRKVGLPPGTLIHVGEKKTEKTRISVFDFDETNLEEKEVERVEDCYPYHEKPSLTWINIDGLHDVSIVDKLGKKFEIHPLILEDILHTGQRPKFEDLGTYMYVVLKMLLYDELRNEIIDEQLSLIVGKDFVITFQEREGDEFDPVRERIRVGHSRIRQSKSDYLAYSLIDAVVDNYFVILEKLGDYIEVLEAELVEQPTSETLHSIHTLKRKLISLRKSIWPLREVVGGLERSESKLFHTTTIPYFRDVYDHTIQAIDTIESYRDIAAGLLEMYLSVNSNRMNEIMKVLTIISTIFIPLTFIAGIYGMNFNFMPELKWHMGYPLIVLIMAIIAGIMLLYFQRKRWL
ncbi:MAG: magnesium/cobalt transporter CorA [Candidatus Zhuqueibacterota bacterium]